MLACTWDNPGVDRYVGTAAAAIYSFASIPAPVRQVLLEKHEKRQSDDVVAIDATSIRGKTYEYESSIRDMHFAANKQCETVTRHWNDKRVEFALVYCEGEYCIAWPAICGNWFIVTRRERVEILVGTPQPIPHVPVPSVFPPTSQPSEPKEDGPTSQPGEGGPISVPPPTIGPVWTYVPGKQPYMPVPIVPVVPEPEVWFLMIGGLIFVMRRSNYVHPSYKP